MMLPGRLERSTLGDVLGTLLRGRATGFLELSELRGPRSGRRHYVFLSSGRPAAVASDGPQLGEILRQSGAASHEVIERVRKAKREGDERLTGELLCDFGQLAVSDIDRGMAKQTRTRLDRLFALPDAELRFRVTSLGTSGLPLPLRAGFAAPQLEPSTFLHGRPRARQREPRATDARRDAFETLGLPPSANPNEIRHAFKRLALEFHPDRALAGADRAELGRRLGRLTAAYALLIQ